MNLSELLPGTDMVAPLYSGKSRRENLLSFENATEYTLTLLIMYVSIIPIRQIEILLEWTEGKQELEFNFEWTRYP